MSSRLLESRRGRFTTFSLLYISEGIPLGFTLTTMATYMRQQGVGLAEIGLFTAALYGPWGFKWAWAPLIDLIRPRRFGPHRTWIVASQSLMILTLSTALFLDLSTNFRLLIIMMVVHNIFAATQDVAIDALAVRVIPSSELGTANGFMFAAAFGGQAIGGSAALFISGLFGFRAAFVLVLLVLVLLLLFVSMRLQEPDEVLSGLGDSASSELGSAVDRLRLLYRRVGGFLRDVYGGFFRSGWGPAVGVLLAFAPKGAIALGLTIATTIRVDMGLNENQIALVSLLGSIAGALGCVAGGWISDRLGHRRSLVTWFALTTLPNLYLMAHLGDDGVVGLTLTAFTLATIGASLTNGLQYGTGNAVFMSLTNRNVAATQFTGYMALCNLANTYTSVWQGAFAGRHGYRRTLGLDALIAIVPIILVCLIRPPRKQDDKPSPA